MSSSREVLERLKQSNSNGSKASSSSSHSSNNRKKKKTKISHSIPIPQLASPVSSSHLPSQRFSSPTMSASQQNLQMTSPSPEEGWSQVGSSILEFSHSNTTPRRPGEVWMTRQAARGSSNDKQIVQIICANDLFPKCKFLNFPVDMEYSIKPKSICQFIISRCNVHSMVDHEHWWHMNKKWVRQSISSLRSNKSQAMRWSFFGEFEVYKVCFPEELN